MLSCWRWSWNSNIRLFETTPNPEGTMSKKSRFRVFRVSTPVLFLRALLPVGLHSYFNSGKCHTGTSTLFSLSINSTGSLLATSSDKGAVIRVWSISGADKLHQFSPSIREAEIHSKNFDSSLDIVGCELGAWYSSYIKTRSVKEMVGKHWMWILHLTSWEGARLFKREKSTNISYVSLSKKIVFSGSESSDCAVSLSLRLSFNRSYS